jgi:hypothetical protein
VVLLGKPEFLGSRGRILTVASYAAVCLCQEIIQEILFVPQPTCAAWDDELALSCVRGSRDRTLAHAARRSASTRNATDATLTVYAAPGPSQDQGVDNRPGRRPGRRLPQPRTRRPSSGPRGCSVTRPIGPVPYRLRAQAALGGALEPLKRHDTVRPQDYFSRSLGCRDTRLRRRAAASPAAYRYREPARPTAACET